MTDLYEFVKNVGVPGGIAFFVLWKVNRTMESMVQEIRGLAAIMKSTLADIERRVDRLESHDHERISS